ncbi:P27 family phage terminase small subunit [Limibacter armeniacum]|uniref:P27 family phage terminase small subunit n=1 Tax=Limibacter armeniacum TaxID=466084 RepID=UPI002FE53FF5
MKALKDELEGLGLQIYNALIRLLKKEKIYKASDSLNCYLIADSMDKFVRANNELRDSVLKTSTSREGHERIYKHPAFEVRSTCLKEILDTLKSLGLDKAQQEKFMTAMEQEVKEYEPKTGAEKFLVHKMSRRDKNGKVKKIS